MSWYQQGSSADERQPLRSGKNEPFSVQIQQIGSPVPGSDSANKSRSECEQDADDSDNERCESDDEASDSELEQEELEEAEAEEAGGNASKGEVERAEIITSFYELDDVRIPPVKFKRALRTFYSFFLAIGIIVYPVKLSKRKQKARRYVPGGEKAARDNEMMAAAGAAPTPLKGERWDWLWKALPKWQVIYYGIFMAALICYTALNVVSAMHSGARFLKVFFAVFLLLSVLASSNLASELLTSRLIGTRIYYTTHNTTHRSHVNKLIRDAIWTPIPFCVAIAALGVFTDYVVRDECRVALQHYLGGSESSHGNPVVHQSGWVEPLVVVWMCCSVLVRLHLLSGLGVFSALVSIHLLRIDSCVRSMKRPGMSVHAASVQVFDVDVSLADLSHTLDVRLTTLLVASTLTFFFEAIFLSNRAKDSDPDNDGSARDLLTLAVPALLCVWILLGCSSVNHAAQRMKLVAQRFAGFQERERLEAKYGATKAKYKEAQGKNDDGEEQEGEVEEEEEEGSKGPAGTEKGDKKKGRGKEAESAKSKSKDGGSDKSKSKAKDDEESAKSKGGDQKKQKKKSEKDTSADSGDRKDSEEGERKTGSRGKGQGKEVAASAAGSDPPKSKAKGKGKKSSKSAEEQAQVKDGAQMKSGHSDPEEDEESGQSESENDRDIAERVREEKAAAAQGEGGDSDESPDSGKLRDRADIGVHALGAEALERSDRDRDGDGDIDIDDDLELLHERLVAFVNYLKYADISLRLANVELDQKLAWGFFLVGVSTIFSVLQIDKLNFLP